MVIKKPEDEIINTVEWKLDNLKRSLIDTSWKYNDFQEKQLDELKKWIAYDIGNQAWAALWATTRAGFSPRAASSVIADASSRWLNTYKQLEDRISQSVQTQNQKLQEQLIWLDGKAIDTATNLKNAELEFWRKKELIDIEWENARASIDAEAEAKKRLLAFEKWLSTPVQRASTNTKKAPDFVPPTWSDSVSLSWGINVTPIQISQDTNIWTIYYDKVTGKRYSSKDWKNFIPL